MLPYAVYRELGGIFLAPCAAICFCRSTRQCCLVDPFSRGNL